MSTALATTAPSSAPAMVKASDQLSAFLGIEKNEMLSTIKAQCFRGTHPDQVTNAQLAAFVSVAAAMQVNPMLPGMLYAYPDRAGIVPIIGPDGIYKRLSEHPDVEGWDVTVFPEDPLVPPTHAVAEIQRRGKLPIKYVAVLSEWKVNANPNWNTRPRHMLGLRALKQAARQVIHGLPGDEDDRIIMNVTATAEDTTLVAPERPEAPARSTKGVAAAKENAAKPVEKVVEKAAEAPAPAKELKRTSAPEVQADFVDKPDTKNDNPAPATAAVEAPAAPVEEKKPITEESPFVPKPTKLVKEGESKTFTVEPDAVIRRTINKTPSVRIELPEGWGEVYHIGGDTNPAWSAIQFVELTISGKKLKNGMVVALVDSVKIADVAPASGDDMA